MRSLLRNDAGGCLDVSTGGAGLVEMSGGCFLGLAQAAHKRNETLVNRIIFMANSEAVVQDFLFRDPRGSDG